MIKIVVILHLLGLIFCNLEGVLGSYNWHTYYWLWDKAFGGGIFVFIVIYKLLRPVDRWIVRPVIIVCFVRLILQIVSYFTKVSINNDISVAISLSALCIAAGWLVLHENSRINVWLSKHLNI